jgi:hypothetical protein
MAENGNKFFSRNNVVTQRASEKLTATWAGHITGGTGRLADIRETTRLSVDFDPGRNGVVSISQFDIEYSIDK